MNKYHQFVLKELLHHQDRHKDMPENIRPSLAWFGASWAFLKETFFDLETDKFIGVRYESCESCGKRCGHAAVWLTEKGAIWARKMDQGDNNAERTQEAN